MFGYYRRGLILQEREERLWKFPLHDLCLSWEVARSLIDGFYHGSVLIFFRFMVVLYKGDIDHLGN